MKTTTRIAAAALIVLGLGGFSAAAQAWGGHHGPQNGSMMGMGGPGGGCQERENPLTTDQAKDIVEGMIAMRGENLKVGAVTEDKDGKIIAELKSASGDLVRRMAFDAKTGRPVSVK